MNVEDYTDICKYCNEGNCEDCSGCLHKCEIIIDIHACYICYRDCNCGYEICKNCTDCDENKEFIDSVEASENKNKWINGIELVLAILAGFTFGWIILG
jgi:hypothetical protein